MNRPGRTLRALSAADWLVLAYLLLLNVAVFVAPPHPLRALGQLQVAGLLGIFLACTAVVRGELLRPGFWSALLYRIGIYGTVQSTYFLFKHLLPVINPGSLDQQLHALDMRLFGVEPAVWFDRFVTPASTEWFAFFYFCYFFILASHVIPIVLGAKNQMLLGEFMFGMLIIVCIGHTGYLLVPGFGPFRAMPELFTRPLPSGLWMDLVWSTVRTNGAMKDIFPSLHTAGPCFIAMLSWRNRAQLPFRYTWPLLAFFAVNIIGATMFLRWHYVIDVVAGFALASLAALVAPRVARWELERRKHGALPLLMPLFGSAAERRASESVGRATAS